MKKAFIGIAAIVALLLIGAVVYLGTNLKKAQDEKNEIQELMEMDRLEMENEYRGFTQQYDELKNTIQNDTLAQQLTAERQRAQQLLEELRRRVARHRTGGSPADDAAAGKGRIPGQGRGIAADTGAEMEAVAGERVLAVAERIIDRRDDGAVPPDGRLHAHRDVQVVREVRVIDLHAVGERKLVRRGLERGIAQSGFVHGLKPGAERIWLFRRITITNTPFGRYQQRYQQQSPGRPIHSPSHFNSHAISARRS